MSYDVSAYYAAETHRKNRLKALHKPTVGILSGRNAPLIRLLHTLGEPNCHQASWEPLSCYYTYAGALILANTVLVRAEANGLHQKRIRAFLSDK